MADGLEQFFLLIVFVFSKVAAPKKIKGFAVLSHSLQRLDVLRILSTNWSQVFKVNPSLETISISTFTVK